MEERKRQALLEAIFAARSLPEVEQVMKQVREWMEAHPTDMTIASAAESLYMLYTALLHLPPKEGP